MHRSHLNVCLALVLGLAGAAACGPSAPEPATPAASAAPADAPAASAAPAASGASTAAPAATGAPATARLAFSTMSSQQKLEHMKAVVMPKMSKVFQEGDAKRYGDFGCKTCHGEKKQDPHVVLPKLTLSGDGFKKLMAAKPEVTKFMAEKVTPAMVEAMGEKPYDPQTHKGFGCGGCHTVN
jgi:hypothetical protein